jgi:Helix-turn-helix domain
MKSSRQNLASFSARKGCLINPHRLFHGVWLPQWLEERAEVSEKAKKLYAYLTYFAGGKGHAWPSLKHLGEKLHVSRRYVIRLVQELSTHRLIIVTNVHNPEKGYCANVYRFLWHPWMQRTDDGDFHMTVCEERSPFMSAESDGRPSEQQITSPSELEDTSPGEPQITPLVIPSSPKENNKKRINNRGKVSATSSPNTGTCSAAPSPGKALSDATKIILERRIAELRMEIVDASKRGNRARADELHNELVAHQTALGFTPDDPPPEPRAPRKKESDETTALSDWPSPTEVRKTFNELRRSLGWPTKDENL